MVKNTSNETDDLKPEFCNYEDEGCNLFPSCLRCPFPYCAEESPLGRKKLSVHIRNREIIRHYSLGKNPKQLALRFNINVRTIQRILKENRRPNS